MVGGQPVADSTAPKTAREKLLVTRNGHPPDVGPRDCCNKFTTTTTSAPTLLSGPPTPHHQRRQAAGEAKMHEVAACWSVPGPEKADRV